MRLDWDAVLGPGDDPWILCANLPYNIATPLVLDVLARVAEVVRSVVMMQREVGERLAARPGDDAYGAVSVRVAYRATASTLRRVPPEVFWPRPKVESVVVRLDRLERATGRRRRGPPVACPRRGVRAASEDDAERPPASRPRPGRSGCGARRERRRRIRASRGARPRTTSPGWRRRCPHEIVTRRAHAKLNAFLRVLGPREDGFHDIQTAILPIELHDVVTVEEHDAS